MAAHRQGNGMAHQLADEGKAALEQGTRTYAHDLLARRERYMDLVMSWQTGQVHTLMLASRRRGGGDRYGAFDQNALAAADYNAAVSREEQVAADFNTAIRAYKAANPD